MRAAGAAALGLVLIVTGCGGASEDPEEVGTEQVGVEQVRGVVLEVDGDLTSVESFLLRTDEGEVLRVVPAPDGDFRFPLPHLHDHLRTSEPLLVELDRSHDPPRATAIRDADDPSWHGEVGTGPTTSDAQAPEETSGAGKEDGLAAPPTSRVDPEAGEEPGALSTTTAATTSTTSATEGTVQEPGDERDVANEAAMDETAGEGTPDGPEQDGQAPEGTEDRLVDGIEDEEAPVGPTIELVIVDGKLEGGARRESVAVGDTVTIRVSGNSADEVHVHGYDLFVHLVDGAGELTFEAFIPGVFEIELEGSHTLLVRLEVS